MMYQPPPPAVTPTKGKRRKGLMIFGIILFVGGLLGGGAIAAKAMSNYKDAVKSLARAPVGCTTTLVFDHASTFTVYVETKGKLGSLSGDCGANGTDYSHPGDKLPKVSMTLVDSNGDEVAMERGVSASYDTDGYVGTAVRSLKIDKPGTYRLDVESDDTDFAVAIGKKPKDDSETMTLIGGGVALGGMVLGLLFFLLGLRRRRPEPAIVDIRNPAAPLPGWPPGPYAQTVPPTPPTQPGFGPEPPPPPLPPTVQAPGQPPIRVPDQPPGTGFAPPSLAPPSPNLPPPAGEAPTHPPSTPPDRVWTLQDEPTDEN
jgi:hypothetical protein